MGGPHAPSAPTQADKNEFPEFNTNPVTLSNFFMDQHDPGTKPAISLSIIVQAIGVASKVCCVDRACVLCPFSAAEPSGVRPSKLRGRSDGRPIAPSAVSHGAVCLRDR